MKRAPESVLNTGRGPNCDVNVILNNSPCVMSRMGAGDFNPEVIDLDYRSITSLIEHRKLFSQENLAASSSKEVHLDRRMKERKHKTQVSTTNLFVENSITSGVLYFDMEAPVLVEKGF